MRKPETVDRADRRPDRIADPRRLPAFLHHVTPAGNLSGILGFGLEPRTRNLLRAHPPRVYLVEGAATALFMCRTLREALSRRAYVRRGLAMDFAFVAIRVADLVHPLRRDASSPNEGDVYSDARIPPEAVRHVDTIDGAALTDENWYRAREWILWGKGRRPAFLKELGRTTGLPGYGGWVSAPRAGDQIDLGTLWRPEVHEDVSEPGIRGVPPGP